MWPRSPSSPSLTSMALLATPLVYLVHAGVERYLGKESAQAMREAALRLKEEQ